MYFAWAWLSVSVPLATLVNLQTLGDTSERRRMTRQAAVTVSASIAANYPIGVALNDLERIAREFVEDLIADIAQALGN